MFLIYSNFFCRHKKEHDEAEFYINFHVDKFLEAVPNAVEKFSDPKRALILNCDSEEADIKYALQFLYNHYPFIRKVHIDTLFKWKNKNLVETCERLDRLNKNMRKPRHTEEYVESSNVLLLQLVCFPVQLVH